MCSSDLIYNSNLQNDVYAIFRTPGQASDTANNLVANDLNTYYASKTGYAVASSFANRTIGGENWSYEVSTYQNSGLAEEIVVFATVHASNAFIIELQAPQQLYLTVDSTYFENILNRFQFQH